jgi:hypothetical protein
LVFSVIWTGDHLLDANLDALKELQKTFPDAPWRHFISANYFLTAKSSQQASQRAARIRALVRPTDKMGLLVEARPELVQKAGFLYRSAPSFYRGQANTCQTLRDCQHDGLLSIYNSAEIYGLLQVSERLFEQQQMQLDGLFMNRFWESTPSISKAAAFSGYTENHSAIPPSLVKRRLRYFPGYISLQKNWAHLDGQLAQPYWQIQEPAPILMVPQSGGIIDYTPPATILQHFRRQLRQARKIRRQYYIFQLVWHQETAAQFQGRVEKTLQGLAEIAKTNRVAIEFQLPSYRHK